MGQEADYNQLVRDERDRYFRFKAALDNSIYHGLFCEFFDCFVSEIRSQGVMNKPLNTDAAIFHANCEWDL